MRLVEQHRIDRHDPRFAAIDAAAFASKNLYNAALYQTRQAFIHHRQVIAYEELARDMKTSVEFRALPAKVAQWVLRQVALLGRAISPRAPRGRRIPHASWDIPSCRSTLTSRDAIC